MIIHPKISIHLNITREQITVCALFIFFFFSGCGIWLLKVASAIKMFICEFD